MNSEKDKSREIYARHMGWFNWPALVVIFLILFVLVLHLDSLAWSAIIAYTNCLVGVTAIVLIAKNTRIDSAVPLLFLPLLIIGWPLASLYLGIFYPDVSYNLLDKSIPLLSGNLRLQLAVLFFMCGYLPIIAISLFRSGRKKSGHCKKPGRIADVVAILAILFLITNVISKVLFLPEPVLYLADGLAIYSQGLLFLPGALIDRLGKAAKIILAIFLPAIVFFYTLGNARGMAMIPCAMFFFGVLFFSSIKSNKKFMLLVIIIFLLPAYVVIGNVTRTVTGTIGFQNLDYRWKAMKKWEEVLDRTPVVASTLGRFFFAGGHSIITRTPEEKPYLSFDFFRYVKELLASLLPGQVYYDPFYRGNKILSNYGFLITETTSVEVSLLGSFWLLGGYSYVIAGGLAVGFLHWMLMIVLRLVRRKNAVMGLLFLGILGSKLIGSAGQDIISQWRTFIWHLIFAFFFWMLTVLLSGIWVSHSPQETVAA